jgi:uncharacterized membrane protein YphA (DoxX/SURF4 family)
MPSLFMVGRVLFVLCFIFAGVQRLMNVTGSAEFFSHKYAVPAALVPIAGQIESLIGLSTAQILALLAGAIELAAGLLVAFNVGTRFMAGVLIVFTALKIFYSYDFWTMADGQREMALLLAVVHVSLIGGLLVLMAFGTARAAEPAGETSV